MMLAEERSKNTLVPVETAKPAPASFGQWLMLIGVAALAILTDQVTKAYVAAHLDLHESWMPIDFIEPVFRFTHVHNRGAAFGLFPQGGMFFLVVAAIVSGVIIYYYRQIAGQAWLVRLALGFQLGGALGNVIDRLNHGYVVDFLHVEYWPVFNVADSCIVIGVALLALAMLIDEYHAARDKAADTSPPENDAPPQ